MYIYSFNSPDRYFCLRPYLGINFYLLICVLLHFSQQSFQSVISLFKHPLHSSLFPISNLHWTVTASTLSWRNRGFMNIYSSLTPLLLSPQSLNSRNLLYQPSNVYLLSYLRTYSWALLHHLSQLCLL